MRLMGMSLVLQVYGQTGKILNCICWWHKRKSQEARKVTVNFGMKDNVGMENKI